MLLDTTECKTCSVSLHDMIRLLKQFGVSICILVEITSNLKNMMSFMIWQTMHPLTSKWNQAANEDKNWFTDRCILSVMSCTSMYLITSFRQSGSCMKAGQCGSFYLVQVVSGSCVHFLDCNWLITIRTLSICGVETIFGHSLMTGW